MMTAAIVTTVLCVLSFAQTKASNLLSSHCVAIKYLPCLASVLKSIPKFIEPAS